MGYGRDEEWVDTYPGVQADDPVWVQRDGTEIYIEDMANRHLRNTIRMLLLAGGDHPQLSLLMEEAELRGVRF
jgi:hypothetical protein